MGDIFGALCFGAAIFFLLNAIVPGGLFYGG